MRGSHDTSSLLCDQRAHLQTTLPGVIGLFRDIDSDITLAFLRRFPSQDKADWLSPTRLGNWLRNVSYNHLANLDRLWDHLHDAPHGTTGPEVELADACERDTDLATSNHIGPPARHSDAPATIR